MVGVWQLQDAKNKLSELVEKALSHGPQVMWSVVPIRFFF
jgi:hypothetical protein